jgi:hypothetical protein
VTATAMSNVTLPGSAAIASSAFHLPDRPRRLGGKDQGWNSFVDAQIDTPATGRLLGGPGASPPGWRRRVRSGIEPRDRRRPI